jgi:autotransporter-associated beta strand protein
VRINVTSGAVNFGSANETLFDLANSGGNVNYGTGNVTITDPTWSGGTNEVHGNLTVGPGSLDVSGGTNTVFGAAGPGGGPGTLTVNGGLNFSGTASPNITVNSDAGTPGKIVLGSDVTSTVTAGTASITSGGSATNPGQLDLNGATRTFTVANGTAAKDMSISAQIIGVTGALTKAGAGALELTGANTYGGDTTVNAGTLLVNNTTGSGTGTGAVTVTNSGSTLAGTGTISGAVTVNAGANIAPGDGANNTAILTTGALTLAATSNFQVDINGTTVGSQYDQLNVTGVTLTGSNLVVTVGTALTDHPTFTIINNVGADPVIGTFAGLAQGATFTSGPNEFSISYTGGTGNDVVLTAVATPEPSTWIGGALVFAALAYTQRRRFTRLLRKAA